MTDKELVQGFLEGDKRQYKIIVGWILDAVRNHAWMDAITPDDIVSAVSEKLLHNLRGDKFKFGSSLKTYVQRMARYTIIDLARSYKRAKDLVTEQNMIVPEVPPPDKVYEDKEEAYLFGKIFSLLGEKCRQVLSMLLLDRLTYKEIGKRLEKTEGAIKSQVGRCKDHAVRLHAKLA